MDVSMLTVALLACPLVFSLIMAALPKTTSYNVFAGLNTISVAATLVLSVVTAGTMLSSGQNIDALGLWLHLDSLSSIFVLLVGIIGFITGVYSISYIKIDIEEKTMPAERTKQYYALFSLFVFTMLLACLSNNIILTGGGRGHHVVDRVPRGHLQEQAGARGVLEVRDGLHRRRGLRSVWHAAHLRERRRYHAQRA